MRLLLVAAALVASGCSAALSFDQRCATDENCVFDSGAGYCTKDHVCVSDIPYDRIECNVLAGAENPSAMTIAALYRLGTKDDDVVNAIKLAVLDINQIGPRALRLVACDSGGNAGQVVKALKLAVEQYDAVAVLGPATSGEMAAIASSADDYVERHGILVVSNSATSPSITSYPDGFRLDAHFKDAMGVEQFYESGYVWRTCPSDALQGPALARTIPATATVVDAGYVDTTYGLGLANAFLAALPPTVTARASSKFAPGSDGSELVDFFQRTAPQYALVIADEDAPRWLKALDSGGAALAGTKFLFTDGAYADTLFAENPSTALLTRVSGTVPAAPSGAAYNAFAPRYLGEFGKPPTATAWVANAFDATYAVALASAVYPVDEKPTGKGLAVGMSRLSSGASIDVGPNDFGRAYAIIAAGDDGPDGGHVNLQGVSGPIDFDSSGDVVAALDLWDVDTSGTMPKLRVKGPAP